MRTAVSARYSRGGAVAVHGGLLGELQMLAVGKGCDGSLRVGAVERRAQILDPFQGLPVGMAVGIVVPAAYDHSLRVGFAQEPVGGSIAAAVVSQLEDCLLYTSRCV